MLFALLRAERTLDEHDFCTEWRAVIKPLMKALLYHGGEPKILLLTRYREEGSYGNGATGINDVFFTVMTAINSTTVENEEEHYTSEMEDFESGMEEDSEDGSGSENETVRMEEDSYHPRPRMGFAGCSECKICLEKWRDTAVEEVVGVKF